MGVEYRHYLLAADRCFVPDAGRVAALVEAWRGERFVFAPDHPHFGARFREGVAVPPHEATGGHALRTIGNPSAPRPMRAAEAAIPVPVPLTGDFVASQRKSASSDPQDDELALVFPVHVPDDRFESFDDMELHYPFVSGGDEALYHDLVVHLSRDFVHHSSENTDPLDTLCACGAELGYEPSESGRQLAIRFESRIHATCSRCGAPFDPNARESGRTSGYTGEPLAPLRGGGAYRFAIVVDCGKGWADGPEIVLAPPFIALATSILGVPLVDFGEFY